MHILERDARPKVFGGRPVSQRQAGLHLLPNMVDITVRMSGREGTLPGSPLAPPKALDEGRLFAEALRKNLSEDLRLLDLRCGPLLHGMHR